jgi:hypothetical protein
LRLLWPIDSKLGKWVTYIMVQLEIIDTQVSVIKVKVTVAKKRNTGSA